MNSAGYFLRLILHQQAHLMLTHHSSGLFLAVMRAPRLLSTLIFSIVMCGLDQIALSSALITQMEEYAWMGRTIPLSQALFKTGHVPLVLDVVLRKQSKVSLVTEQDLHYGSFR